jgi:hypothetical protein
MRLTRLDILALQKLAGDALQNELDDETLKSIGLKRREAEEFRAKIQRIREMSK